MKVTLTIDHEYWAILTEVAARQHIDEVNPPALVRRMLGIAIEAIDPVMGDWLRMTDEERRHAFLERG